MSESAMPPTNVSMAGLVLAILILANHFCRNVRIRGPIESWLGNVETAMFEAVRK